MILEVKGLNKSFRHPWNLQWIPVLKDVSFSIADKSVVGFLGSNGAGKTTSIKCILNLLSFQSGDITILGEDHKSRRVKKQIGFLPERPYFYNHLTAQEFLAFYGQLSTTLSGKDMDARIDELLELVGMTHAKKLFLSQFSKGMLQRIGMAQALIHHPKLLILDEPLSGLDPDGRMQMSAVIGQVSEMGTTVFFSSHLLDDVDKMCDKLVVIRQGVLSYSGNKDDFVSKGKRHFSVKYAYQEKLIEEDVPEGEELQKRIDELRGKNAYLLELKPKIASLEDAFREFNQN